MLVDDGVAFVEVDANVDVDVAVLLYTNLSSLFGGCTDYALIDLSVII